MGHFTDLYLNGVGAEETFCLRRLFLEVSQRSSTLIALSPSNLASTQSQWLLFFGCVRNEDSICIALPGTCETVLDTTISFTMNIHLDLFTTLLNSAPKLDIYFLNSDPIVLFGLATVDGFELGLWRSSLGYDSVKVFDGDLSSVLRDEQ
ncbi:hypothetical protein BLNAU_6131 [Blattamonas nauphoetae]|uniref:Uncharacterized protein n=1 Tax=Blattamonas nauphoetae TaxID=2049346 RepID=A0ABQ9Y564_9EUKA|nr:hypothetical protein BLNAU_6131 [Blattamonas nauphoetae]